MSTFQSGIPSLNMSMPFNTNTTEVFEDDTHFLVRIHPENRDRAKKIVGRQWDGDRKAWVYPKDPLTYEALVEEFQKDADSFNIRRPKTKRPAGIKPTVEETDNEDFNDQLLEEILSFNDIGEGQVKIHSELEQVRVMIESLRDDSANQNLMLKELCVTQEEATNALTKFRQPIQQIVKTEAVEVLPKLLDLSKPKEKELLEKVLIEVACLAVGQDKSFRQWVRNYSPLSLPTDFINATHELLKKHLSKLVNDENGRADFADLIRRLKEDDMLFDNRLDPTVKLIPILYTLNAIRNRFAHPPIDSNKFEKWNSEKWSRAILYLMNLALVWSKLDMEVEGEKEDE